MMVGRELSTASYKTHRQSEVVLDVKNISGKGFQDINFRVHKGEIFGFAGLLGSGRTELAKALFGDEPVYSGTITKGGKQLQLHHPADAIQHHIAYVPDDRKAVGVFLDKSVAENIAAAKLQQGLYRVAAVATEAERLQQKLHIKTPSVKQVVRQLSGGNQQKVVMAKWLNTAPDLLIFNEPTHGVDVGAKGDIYDLLKGLTAEGKSILLISSELPELLLLADRIAVMYMGRIQAILNREEATEEKIAALASGI
jgi:ribose transport system ATP-binding protein